MSMESVTGCQDFADLDFIREQFTERQGTENREQVLETKGASAAEVGDEIQNQREYDACQDAGDDGEENRHVLTAVGDVAGEPSKRKPNARCQHNDRADDDDHEAEPDDGFADVEHERTAISP